MLNDTGGWSLILSAAWWLLQLVFVTTVFVVGQPYGSLSDLSVALNVILLAPLAFFIHVPAYSHYPPANLGSSAIGAAGILSATVASILIMVGWISFEPSLPPVMAGFAANGIWLLIGCLVLRGEAAVSSGLVNAGLLVGVGLAAIALLFLWGDVNAVYLSGALWSDPLVYPVLALGAIGFIGLPAWTVLLGRHLPAGTSG